MRLTIGLAVYDDFCGAYFTIQALRLYHPPVEEILIVDNHPQGVEGKMLEGLAGATGARYVPMPEPVGTSPPRQRIFEEASGDVVLVVDSHVLLLPGSLEALRNFYSQYPDCPDLIHAVLIYDDLKGYSTHFRDQWRAEMWGVWDSDVRGEDPKAPAFEIPASGLGVFACRKEAWLGFHPHARAFGGEEWYIHEKFRQHGRRVLCLPGLRYLHRFGRAAVPYPLTQWNKVRNYILELQELGIPLDRLRRHFVDLIPEPDPDGGPGQAALHRMPAEIFDKLAADPIHTLPERLGVSLERSTGCGGCGGADKVQSAEEWYQWQRKHHPDLSQHLPRLRALATDCRVVAEMGNSRGGSTAALLAAKPERLISIDIQRPSWEATIRRLSDQSDVTILLGDSREVDLPEAVDLLFIDTVHRADYLYPELVRHAPHVRRWIVLHDTEIFGEMGERRPGDDGPVPGLLPALRRFLREHQEWSVVEHRREQYGLTILSRLAEDKPKLPSTARQIFNFAKAALQHIHSGRPMVTEEQLAQRLDICAVCEHRNGNRCSICGCYLIDAPTGQGGKAEWADQSCPIGKWLPLETDSVNDPGSRK